MTQETMIQQLTAHLPPTTVTSGGKAQRKLKRGVASTPLKIS